MSCAATGEERCCCVARVEALDPLFAAMRDITPNQLIICPTSAAGSLASEAVFDALAAALEVRR